MRFLVKIGGLDNGIDVCEVATEGSNLGEGVARPAYIVLCEVAELSFGVCEGSNPYHVIQTSI